MAKAVAPVAAPATTPLPAKQGIPGTPAGMKVKGYTPPIEPPAETPLTGIFAPDAAQPPAPQLGNLGLGYTAGGMTPRLGSGAMNPFNLGDAPQVQDGTTDVTRADRGQGYNPTSPLDFLLPAPGVEQVINPAGLQQATPQEARNAKFQNDPVGLAMANAGAAAQPALDYWKGQAQGFGKGLVTAARDAGDTLLAANRPSAALGGVRPLSHILAGLATIGSGARVGQEVFKNNEATNQEPAKLASGLADATAERKLREAQTGQTLANTDQTKVQTSYIDDDFKLKYQALEVQRQNAATAQEQNRIAWSQQALSDKHALWQKDLGVGSQLIEWAKLNGKQDPNTALAGLSGVQLEAISSQQLAAVTQTLQAQGYYKPFEANALARLKTDLGAGELTATGEGGSARPVTGDEFNAFMQYNKAGRVGTFSKAQQLINKSLADKLDRQVAMGAQIGAGQKPGKPAAPAFTMPVAP
jgi:hypothetical protein